MKTKKILGLGICALSLGMVAGVIGTRAAVEARADVTAGWYLTGLGDKWSPAESRKADATPATGDVATWANVEIPKWNNFKLAYAENGAASFNGDSWKGMSEVKSFPEGEFKDYGGGNIGAEVGGTYNIHLYPNPETTVYEITIEKVEVPVTYTVKIGDGEPIELAKNTSASLAEGQKAEYYVEGKNVTKNQALVFAANSVAITSHIGGDEGSNTVFTTVEEVTSAKIHNDKENANIYFKVWNDGGYSVYVTGYEQGPTGWYICNASSWGPADGKLSEGSNAQNVAYWLDINMAADYEFTIAEFIDGERAAQYDLGWSDVSEDWSSEYAKFEAGASDNHIKVKTAGVYSVYVTAGETKKICLNGTGLTPEVIQKAKDLHDYVSTAGSEDYTETAEELRNKSCADKYAAALEDYNDLGEAGQKYFRDNYADDYAIMEYWHNKTANPSSLYKVSGLAGNNPTLIITLSVIAGAAVAGAGIYLISKKRKHN